nr:MAG TPA: hypothetical protein [Caudoviricetes sp.]
MDQFFFYVFWFCFKQDVDDFNAAAYGFPFRVVGIGPNGGNVWIFKIMDSDQIDFWGQFSSPFYLKIVLFSPIRTK